MKKIGVIFTAIMLLAVLLCCFVVFFDYNDTIFCTSYRQDVYDGFSYYVRHKRISATGVTYEFETNQQTEVLFGNLKETFMTFQEDDDKISVIYNNEIFSIKKVSNKKNTYVLYGEYFIYTNGSEFCYIPFPTEQIADATYVIPRIETENFKIKSFDIEYYKKFYSNYQDISVNDNMISGENFTLLVSNNEVLIHHTDVSTLD